MQFVSALCAKARLFATPSLSRERKSGQVCPSGCGVGWLGLQIELT